MNIEEYTSIINDIICDECDKPYCTIKEILINMHHDPRNLLQIKLVSILKYIESQKENRDIGWAEAFTRWINRGYAKKFADIYKEGIKIKEIKEKLYIN